MQAVVGDREFPVVTDSNKKDGRRAAAEAALRVLAEEGRYGVKLEKQKVQEPTKVFQVASECQYFTKLCPITH